MWKISAIKRCLSDHMNAWAEVLLTCMHWALAQFALNYSLWWSLLHIWQCLFCQALKQADTWQVLPSFKVDSSFKCHTLTIVPVHDVPMFQCSKWTQTHPLNVTHVFSTWTFESVHVYDPIPLSRVHCRTLDEGKNSITCDTTCDNTCDTTVLPETHIPQTPYTLYTRYH